MFNVNKRVESVDIIARNFSIIEPLDLVKEFEIKIELLVGTSNSFLNRILNVLLKSN